MARIALAGLLLCLFACDPPPAQQALGEPCNMSLKDYNRCAPGLYCREASLVFRVTKAAGAEVGRCTRRLAEGEACVNKDADCETWLVCEAQSGVCRPRSALPGDQMRNDEVTE